jgi:BON domain
VSGGRVILEGTVPDRRMKHAIEDVADATSGVNDVENRVRVVRSWPHMREEQRGDGSGSDTRGEDVTQRHGTGTTSSHTSTGTQTEEHATGASEGATFGGATTALSEDASGSGAPYQGNNTASRGPGTADDLAGRSVSSSSTAKPPSE